VIVAFFGDVVGRPGRQALAACLPALRRRHRPDFILANAENAAGGTGLTPDVAEELFDLGLDGMTLSNHAWAKRELIPYLEHERRILRPLNLPGNPAGAGSAVLEPPGGGLRLGLISLLGRVFMTIHPDDPFRVGLAEARRLRALGVAAIIVDIHAEATSEKVALGWHLDGEVSAVLGTHTHVQTADERILPRGTAYLTDLGMSGPVDSVIGVETKSAVERFLTQLPVRFEPASGPAAACGAVVEVDASSGLATRIERFAFPACV
jgi:metallophosphoesterase (TIGR00282 family)